MKLSDNGCAIFYDFWLTQYTLRNKSFVKDYEEARTAYEALQSTGIISDNKDKENFDTHQTGFEQREMINNFAQHSLPKSSASKHVVTLFDFAQKYNFFRLSCQTVKMDKVLELISEGKGIQKKPGIFRMKLNEFETISSVKNEVILRANNKESMYVMAVSIDTSKEYELMIREVSALYWERKYEASLLYRYKELVNNNPDKNDIECHEIASSDVENIYNKATDAYNEMWSFKAKSLKKHHSTLTTLPALLAFGNGIILSKIMDTASRHGERLRKHAAN